MSTERSDPGLAGFSRCPVPSKRTERVTSGPNLAASASRSERPTAQKT